MSQGDLAWLAYPWRGRQERVVRIGDGGTAILILAPLFEEANRTRHFLIETMRHLAGRGYSCFLPDLPGTLESTVRLETVEWRDWEQALADIVKDIGAPLHIASVRGGALLDGGIMASSRWRLAPTDGVALLRDLIRTRMAADREAGRTATADQVETEALTMPFDVAGYRFNPRFLAEMKNRAPASAGAIRTVRLETDPHPAEALLSGQPLWRRSEPGHDPVLSQHIASDIEQWIATCDNG